MSQRRSDYARQDGEDYATPRWVARPIARELRKLNVAKIWEPANGGGALTAALEAERFAVIPTGGDFLERSTPPHDDLDAIVTNPPYGPKGRNETAVAFIRHALAFPVRVVAMLLTADFDSGRTRVDLFRDNPRFALKIVLLDRIVWFERPGAAPSTNHAWFVWTGADTAREAVARIAYAERAA
jgi:hypothetical protein